MMGRTLVRAAALYGTIDAAQFLATRYQDLKKAPGRFYGTIAYTALWGGLLASSVCRKGRNTNLTRSLALTTTLASGALLAAHAKQHLVSVRTVGPVVAAGTALLGACIAAEALEEE